MKRLGFVAVTVLCMVASANAQWSDNFDSYATGSQLIGQGGWAGWDNSAAAGGFVSSTQAVSLPNSIAVAGPSDLVRPVAGVNSGQWLLTGNVFVPGNFTGTSWFIAMNTYVPNTAAQQNWSMQMQFQAANNQVTNLGGSGNTPGAGITVTPQPLVRDQWVPIEVALDFTNNTHVVKYNGAVLTTGAWSSGAGSNVAFSTVDLFANNSSAVYYDDLNLQPVPEPTVFVTLVMGLVGLVGLRRKK